MRARNTRIFCLPWFNRVDYPAMREALVNGERMPETYDGWRAMADSIVQQILDQGGAVERIVLEPRGFVAWCREHGVPVDEQAVSGFVSGIAASYRGADRVAARIPLAAVNDSAARVAARGEAARSCDPPRLWRAPG